MSGDLEVVVHESRESRLGESVRVPPAGRMPLRPGVVRTLRIPLPVAVVFALMMALGLVLPFPSDRPTTFDEPPGSADGGLLADLRGEDVLHRLETTQAALKHEMAMMREAPASRGGVPLPDEVEAAFVFAAHAAQLELLRVALLRRDCL